MRQILLLAWMAVAVPAFAGSPPHTVAELMQRGVVRSADLSPGGRRIAIAMAVGVGKSDEVTIIELTPAGDVGSKHRIALPEIMKSQVEWVDWATDERLLMSIIFNAPESKEERDARLESRTVLVPTRRIYGVNPDGTKFTLLFSGSSRALSQAYDLGRVVDLSEAAQGRVMIPAWVGHRNNLFSVDIYSGAATPVAHGSANTYSWAAQGGQAVLRFDVNFRGTTISVYGRRSPTEDWNLVTRYATRGNHYDWQFAGMGPAAGQAYVRARVGGEDKASIYVYDLEARKFGERIATRPDYDVLDAVLIDGRYAGVSYYGDRLHYLLESKRLQLHLDGINKYFGDAANVTIVGIDSAGVRLLLDVDGPTMPGDLYFYDVRKKNLQFLQATWPGIEPGRLAPTTVVRAATRDGAAVTSYLTRPRETTKPPPLVVAPHGGPEDRDHLAFDPFVQSLAAQGWAVLQTNFRGSAGYGRAFTEAGHRQWALRMQDDVTDAVRDLVTRGVVDPDRIAIVGTSYGGYAALAAAVVTPGLYRASVARAGVSDLVEMLYWERKDEGAGSDGYKYWVKNIGDPKKDEVALRAASPSTRASEIRVPVLLVHGVDDDVVPVEQSRIMKKALEKLGKPVRLIEVEHEAHDGWSAENERQYVEDTIGFLKPYLR